MQQQASVTMSGFVGSEPMKFGHDPNVIGCTLSIGHTPTYFHAHEQQWKERPTTWMTVKAYRGLAKNVLNSVHKGDAVIVSGLLATESWSHDGTDHSRVVLEASAIGHDLNRGTSVFSKQSSSRANAQKGEESEAYDTSTSQETTYPEEESEEVF